jgi:L-threonate 2-dehydrogenase
MDSSLFPVGIIGLGPYGMAFAELLMQQGLRVIGYRRSGMDAFIAAGGVAAASPAELVMRSEIVLDCLPHEDALLTLFDGPFSIMDALRPGQVILSLASHSLAAKQRLADLVAERGGVVLDGAVDGTAEMAAQRQATIYVSGDAAAVAHVTSLLDRLTPRLIPLGAFGEASRFISTGGENS